MLLAFFFHRERASKFGCGCEVLEWQHNASGAGMTI